jgi:hypothetical protein
MNSRPFQHLCWGYHTNLITSERHHECLWMIWNGMPRGFRDRIHILRSSLLWSIPWMEPRQSRHARGNYQSAVANTDLPSVSRFWNWTLDGITTNFHEPQNLHIRAYVIHQFTTQQTSLCKPRAFANFCMDPVATSSAVATALEVWIYFTKVIYPKSLAKLHCWLSQFFND